MARALLGLSDSSTIFAKMTNISIVFSDEIEDVSNFDKTRQNGLQNNWLLRAYMANIKK